MDDYKENVSQMQQGSSTYELIAIETVCTGPMPAQASHNPSMERSGHEVPPLAEEPLAIDNCRENQFSVRVWPLLDLPQSSGRAHIQESMSIPN